jgi:hypothetical protein
VEYEMLCGTGSRGEVPGKEKTCDKRKNNNMRIIIIIMKLRWEESLTI